MKLLDHVLFILLAVMALAYLIALVKDVCKINY